MRVTQKLLLTRRIEEPFLSAANVCGPTVGAEHIGMEWGPGNDTKILYCEKTTTKSLSNYNLNVQFSDHEPLGPM